MRSIPLRAALALLLMVLGMATQLNATIASSAHTADINWQRSSLFGRNSRNLRQRNTAAVRGDLVADVGGEPIGMIASNLNNAGYNNEYGQLFAPYDIEKQQQQELPQQQVSANTKTEAIKLRTKWISLRRVELTARQLIKMGITEADGSYRLYCIEWILKHNETD